MFSLASQVTTVEMSDHKLSFKILFLAEENRSAPNFKIQYP